jgi:hypothetical protein
MAEAWDLEDWAVLPLIPAPLSDEQWQEVIRCSELPPPARPVIARAIAMYRVFEDARRRSRTPAETRALVVGASKLASTLRSNIAQLLRNPRAIVNLTLTLEPPSDFARKMNERLAENRMANTIDVLDQLSEWFSAAAKKIPKVRPGAKEKALQIQLLVAVLDRILLHFRGKGITRSNKKGNRSREYILTICRLADPKARHFPIEDAMKRQIRSRGRIRKSSRP